MAIRITLVTVVFVSLVAIDPAWISPDWNNPTGWLGESRPDDVVAAVIRLVALALTGTQLTALAAVALGRVVGSRGLQRLAQRALIPALRGVVPLVLVAGTALPATASELRLPIVPPAVEPIDVPPAPLLPASVFVQVGDSMWRIAAAHTDGDVGPYWRRMVDLNRHRFDNVDLIHPGDTVLLPPVNPGG